MRPGAVPLTAQPKGGALGGKKADKDSLQFELKLSEEYYEQVRRPSSCMQCQAHRQPQTHSCMQWRMHRQPHSCCAQPHLHHTDCIVLTARAATAARTQACLTAACPPAENVFCCLKHVDLRTQAEAEGRRFTRYDKAKPADYPCESDKTVRSRGARSLCATAAHAAVPQQLPGRVDMQASGTSRAAAAAAACRACRPRWTLRCCAATCWSQARWRRARWRRAGCGQAPRPACERCWRTCTASTT